MEWILKGFEYGDFERRGRKGFAEDAEEIPKGTPKRTPKRTSRRRKRRDF
jgi:hypothetical protein